MAVSKNSAPSVAVTGRGKSTRWKFWRRHATDAAPAAPTSDEAPTSVTSAISRHTDQDGKLTTRVHFEIRHWVKGRLRLEIPRLSQDPSYQERLTYLIIASSSAFRVRVNPGARSLVIHYDPGDTDASEILQQITICIQEATEPGVAIEPRSPEKSEEIEPISYRKRLGLPAVALALSAGAWVGGVAAPPLLLGGVIIAAAIPAYKRAWEGIRYEKKLNVDFLDALAITTLTSLGHYFPPAFMISLIESGEIIRDLTARRTARANLDLLDSLGSTAWIVRDGVEVEVDLKHVVEGDIVIVYPGDQIPVDGTVVGGIGIVDQQKLTGESIPITREEGNDVFAATLVIDGKLRIEARRTGNNTRAGVVVALMKSAPIHDTRTENYARKIGDRVVVPTLAIGAAATLATGSVIRGVGVITLDIGTGMRVSVPTAILSSLTYAARNGILIRSGRAIEQLAGVDTIVFDKTGTLTQGKAGVVGVCTSTDDIDSMEVLRLAASAEQGLTHPVAEAIIRHAREQEVALSECEEWEYRIGQGIAAEIGGRTFYVGSHRMMVNLGIDTDAIIERHPEIETSAASQVYVAEGDTVLGVILYKDPARPESPYVISTLHEMKITPYMLSGDVQSVATAIAAELGIAPQNVYAEAFPERKVEVVKEFKDAGKTIAFVGDGINDSAALAHASVSVSFAGATDMARETADIVLMDDDLASLILAIQVAKQAMNVVRQNTGIVLGPNLTAIVYAAFIGLNPIAAVVINNGSAIAAEMNGFRPLLGPPNRRRMLAAPADKAQLPDGEPVAQLSESTDEQDPVLTNGATHVNGHRNGVTQAKNVDGDDANVNNANGIGLQPAYSNGQ